MKKEYRKGFMIGYGILLGLILLLEIFQIHTFTFSLLSLLINIGLIHGVLEIIKVCKISFSKEEWIVIISAILLIYLFYGLNLLTRQFVYYWDYSSYYNMQMESISRFLEGPSSGIRFFLDSTWSGEYGNFLSFLPQFFFALTNQTISSYISSYILIFTPYLMISFGILLKVLSKKWKKMEEEKVFIVLFLTILFNPIFHGTAILGQPDFFGLFFLFCILSLTISYSFEKRDVKRWFLIFCCTLFLLISRRWYLYWIVTYYAIYGISVLLSTKKKKRKMVYQNIFLFAGVSGILLLVLLFPLIKNIVIANFQSSYSFYKEGGFFQEWIYQKNHIGLLSLGILLLGIYYGIKDKETRKETMLMMIQYTGILLLFTKIQNMGIHHSLLLLPCTLFFFYCFVKNCKKEIIFFLYTSILVINFVGPMMKTSSLWSDISLKPPYQEDYQELGKVVDYVESLEGKLYMIPHNSKYNPDRLRNYKAPDQTIKEKLPYGSAILGTQPFPIELLEADYVITTNPFDSISLEEKYESVFEQLCQQGVYLLEKDFDMKNGYQLIIYKRVVELSEEEIDLYLETMKEETKEYPSLYEEILIQYKNKNFTEKKEKRDSSF